MKNDDDADFDLIINNITDMTKNTILLDTINKEKINEQEDEMICCNLPLSNSNDTLQSTVFTNATGYGSVASLLHEAENINNNKKKKPKHKHGI